MSPVLSIDQRRPAAVLLVMFCREVPAQFLAISQDLGCLLHDLFSSCTTCSPFPTFPNDPLVQTSSMVVGLVDPWGLSSKRSAHINYRSAPASEHTRTRRNVYTSGLVQIVRFPHSKYTKGHQEIA